MQYECYELKKRRYDLDWLRVLAFGILILYHAGMFYVADWGWHIKSDNTSVMLQYLMMLVNPWRMPLLFFISGAAMWFAARKISATGLLRLRLVRLLPPLVLGMLVIVPPQMYFQILQSEGVDLRYFEFYRLYLDINTDRFPDQQTPVGLMTWNHLWFIPYILVYTMVFIVAKPVLDRIAEALDRVRVPLWVLYLLPPAMLLQYGLFLRPHFPQNFALVGDWYSHALYFTLFAGGYVMAGQMQIARMLASSRWICLALSLLGYILLIMMYRGTILNDHDSQAEWAIRSAIRFFNGWSWLLTVMAWAAAWLNRPSRALAYMNTAILPWYVLHQTITILLAWYLSPLGLNTGLEAVLVVVGTVAACAAGYELIRRFTVTRFLFGLKLERRRAGKTEDRVYSTS